MRTSTLKCNSFTIRKHTDIPPLFSIPVDMFFFSSLIVCTSFFFFDNNTSHSNPYPYLNYMIFSPGLNTLLNLIYLIISRPSSAKVKSPSLSR